MGNVSAMRRGIGSSDFGCHSGATPNQSKLRLGQLFFLCQMGLFAGCAEFELDDTKTSLIPL